MDGLGEAGGFLQQLGAASLRLGEQFAVKQLGLSPQQQAISPLYTTYPAQPVSTASGGVTFGMDNSTMLLLGVAVVAIIVIMR